MERQTGMKWSRKAASETPSKIAVRAAAFAVRYAAPRPSLYSRVMPLSPMNTIRSAYGFSVP